MKRLLAFSALALAIGLSYASAQSITKSLQGSQDPRGPVGMDSSNNSFFPNHINATGANGSPPTLSNCANGTITSPSTDNAGSFTPNQGSCTLLFGTTFTNTPHCTIHPTGGTTADAWTEAASGVTFSTVSSGVVHHYICLGNE